MTTKTIIINGKPAEVSMSDDDYARMMAATKAWESEKDRRRARALTLVAAGNQEAVRAVSDYSLSLN